MDKVSNTLQKDMGTSIKIYEVSNLIWSSYFYESFCYWLQGLTGNLPFLLINLLITQHTYLKQNTMHRKPLQ